MRRGRPKHADILTPREWQVLSLLRDGLTNEQIAARLGISENGAKYHVGEILSKLGVASRREAAAWRPAPSQRFGAVAVVWSSLRKLSGGSIAGGVGGLAVIAGVTFVALLALGVIVMRERDDASPAAGELGRLAFVRDGDLWVKALPQGTARRLTQGAGVFYPRWSPSGEWLLAGDLVIRADGSRRRDAAGCVAWSPVADEFACLEPDRGFRIESADGSSRRTIGLDALLAGAALGTTVRGPTWSPDGRRLAYASDGVLQRSEPRYQRRSGLWIVEADGSGAREVYSGDAYSDGGEVGVIGWSPDGSTVLISLNPQYSVSSAADGLLLYAAPVSGGPPRRMDVALLTRDELMGGFAVDGSLAITEGGGREVWTGKSIAVLDIATGTSRPLTGEGSAAFGPAWSPDSTRIAYAAGPDIGHASGGEPARQGMMQRRIWLMNADGSGKRQLTNDESFRDERPQWSADGASILFARLDVEGAASLWLVPSAGGSPSKLADLSRPSGRPDTPLWFGFYGYVAWNSYYAWWPGRS